MMVCLVLYAYCVGVFSSRTIAWACERHLAFLAIVGQERPDFRTISDCRQRPLEACKDGFVHVGRLAGAMGLVRLGNVATDGTKMQGNASRHKAMRYGYMQKAVERSARGDRGLGGPGIPAGRGGGSGTRQPAGGCTARRVGAP